MCDSIAEVLSSSSANVAQKGEPMSETDLNALGVICNLAGIALAFFFGFPHPEDVKAHRVKHLLWSRAGLALLFIGFALQLGAIWVGSAPQ